MLLSIRHRRATMAVAALVASTPPLVSGVVFAGPSPAQGAPARGSGHEVVFTGGGLFGVRCATTPSTASVTVPSETTLRVVNDTSRRARLMLDGVAQGELGGGSAADVLFHRGPVSVALKPICLSTAVSPVRVDVDATVPGEGSAVPESVPDGLEGARPSATMAPDGSAGSSGGAGDAVAPNSWPAGPAAEATGSVEPLRERGPVGLLALIATVCVVGVAAGAIRAIIAQRVTRTVVA